MLAILQDAGAGMLHCCEAGTCTTAQEKFTGSPFWLSNGVRCRLKTCHSARLLPRLSCTAGLCQLVSTKKSRIFESGCAPCCGSCRICWPRWEATFCRQCRHLLVWLACTRCSRCPKIAEKGKQQVAFEPACCGTVMQLTWQHQSNDLYKLSRLLSPCTPVPPRACRLGPAEARAALSGLEQCAGLPAAPVHLQRAPRASLPGGSVHARCTGTAALQPT